MKLLFDHNLSPRLASRLADLYPAATHVVAAGMAEAFDQEVWEFARAQVYIIVTKDADFNDLSVLYGFPPKVIWIRLGNCTTSQVETLLRNRLEAIQEFATDEQAAVLTLL